MAVCTVQHEQYLKKNSSYFSSLKGYKYVSNILENCN
jgi:hypothetical protein